MAVKRSCKCFDSLDTALANDGWNCVVDRKLTINFGTKKAGTAVAIPLRKKDSSKRKPLPTVLMVHCPLCGKKLE